MPIVYPEVLAVSSERRTVVWSDREVILYALGVGYGADPLDAADLPFVYEQNLKATPSFATVLTSDFVLRERIGMDPTLSVHGGHKVVWGRPLPPRGKGVVTSRVTEVFDKGPGKGAIVVTETELLEDGQTTPTVTATLTRFARGDGGCGAPGGGPGEPHRPPPRAPDVSVDVATTANQALLYRLSGDLDPLHADPEVARAAGFPRPILHGLCSFGIACRAVLRTYAGDDPGRLRSQAARFSAPIYPGEAITLHMWRDGPVISFEAEVRERSVKAMTNGKIELVAAS